MQAASNDRLRSILNGALGFTMGGIASLLTVYLIARSGVLGWLLGFIPDEQDFIRLFAAIILAFLTIGVGGAVGGLINGFTLHSIDPQASRRRYMWSSAYAFAVAEGIVIIPMLLLLSVIGIYNNGSIKDPTSFMVIAGLFGIIYGLLSGLILSLLTIRFRYSWSVFLAALLGFLLGGVALGLALWRADLLSLEVASLLRGLIMLAVFCFVFFAPAGILLGLTYNGLANKRAEIGSDAVEASGWQRIFVLVVSALVFIFLMSFQQTIVNFLTVRPGTEAPYLVAETAGVHWLSPIKLLDGVVAQDEGYVDIGVNDSGQVAITWSDRAEGEDDIFYTQWSEDGSGTFLWTNPYNISNNPESISVHPQSAVDSSGEVHIVWAEEVPGQDASRQIVYSHCSVEECTQAVVISDIDNLECAADIAGETENNDWPAIAINDQDQIMVAWSAGRGLIPFTTWSAGETPPDLPTGCVPSQTRNETQPRLDAGVGGSFFLAYASRLDNPSSELYALEYDGQDWRPSEATGARGHSPGIFSDSLGHGHVAWCGEDGSVGYQQLGASAEFINFPVCMGRPELAQDADGRLHLLWYGEEVETNTSQIRNGSYILESIRSDQGWSEPAIVANLKSDSQPVLATQSDGKLHMTATEAADGDSTIYYSRQDPYDCSPGSLNRIADQAVNAIQAGGYYPADYQLPYCQNQFVRFVYMPNPEPGFTNEAPNPNGGFDTVKELTKAEYEILFATMQWEPDKDDQSPGFTYADAVSNLYRSIKENPERYPRGLTVRILLGNYPELSNMNWGDQIWAAIEDLREAGVEEMVNPELGWNVEVANYPGTYPHSHTKFMVVDGKRLMSAGFNYGWLHYPREHPSGAGDDLTDLGIFVDGPVAQAALITYDDMWVGADQIYCSDFYPQDGSDWKESCVEMKASGGHPPEVKKYYLAGSETTLSLYRTHTYKEADEALAAALASAEESLDIMQVNFSAELICMANHVFPQVCTFDQVLPWMEAVVEAIDSNHVYVRAIVENANSNGLENRVGINILEKELARRGLSEYFEARFFDGRLHTKSVLIDKQLLVVGSQNFHYSAFGDGGLLEYSVATDSPEAIQTYQDMFEYYWELAIPADEAEFATTAS